MKAREFTLDAPAWTGIGTIERPAKPEPRADASAEPKLSWMERFDRWLWKQEVREREAYLAGSRDIFELEARIRQLERSSGWSCY
jgi:hypothetical protein